MWFPLAQKHLAKAAALADRAKVLTDFDEIKAEAAYIQGTTAYCFLSTYQWMCGGHGTGVEGLHIPTCGCPRFP